MEDRILRDILNEISALRTAIEELTSSVERLRGVGSFKADLHDLKTALEDIERTT